MPGENLKAIEEIQQSENGIGSDEHDNVVEEEQVHEAKIADEYLIVHLSSGLNVQIPLRFLPYFDANYPLPEEAELLILRRRPAIERLFINDAALTVYLKDGRVLSVPLAWFPRLVLGTSEERNHYYFGGFNDSIHWPDLDEDIGLEGLFKMTGKSNERNESILRWFEERKKSLQ